MKYLVMCEGSNELEVVRILLAKRYICCGKKRYNNSSKFYHDYYSGDCDKLVNAICEYKRSRGAHQKDELYLADLLRV